MAKPVKRPEFRAHILVVDTNILWNNDKKPVADPNFSIFWDTHSSEFPLELAIPEVVFDELKFQHNTSARKAMVKATDNLKDVSRVTGTDYRHRVTERRIASKIDEKFEKWRKKHGARILRTPYSKIDWKLVVHNSIWRRPPFEFGERKDRSEKGFRDSVILETLVEFVSGSSASKSISFVCDDVLLRTTADNRLSDIEHFSVFESLDEFEAYLRLLKEDLTNQFIRSILRKVSNRFCKKGDENSLYYQFDIRQLMNDQGDIYSKTPTLADPPKGLLGISGSENWTEKGVGRYWIYPPVFQELEGENIYHWQTRVEFSKSFGSDPSTVANAFVAVMGPKLLLLEFRVDWCIKIGQTARLWQPRLKGVELLTKSFTFPTRDQISDYDLENES